MNDVDSAVSRSQMVFNYYLVCIQGQKIILLLEHTHTLGTSGLLVDTAG